MDTSRNDDPHDLGRFVNAQNGVYNRALAELRSRRKKSHWMWFIFPQIDGLGHSPTAQHYAIKSRQEARAYLDHPVLDARLTECAETVLAIQGSSASAIFGYPDDLKLRSSMTLFEAVADPESIFARVLDRYHDGERDAKSLQLLDSLQ